MLLQRVPNFLGGKSRNPDEGMVGVAQKALGRADAEIADELEDRRTGFPLEKAGQVFLAQA